MSLEKRIREFIATMAKIKSPVVPAVIANDLEAILEAATSTQVHPALAQDLRMAIGGDLDRLVGATFRGSMSDHAFRAWALSDGQAVSWEFRDNSWQEGMWASITKVQYEGYLGPDVTGPQDSWQVRALFERPATLVLAVAPEGYLLVRHPLRWSREESHAWHLALPDVYRAFDDLAAATPNPEHGG